MICKMNIFCKKFTSSRSFGVELEIGNEVSPQTITSIIANSSKIPVKNNLYKSSINNNFWDVKMDGSCGKSTDEFGINEGGYEITSFKACGIKQLQHICSVVRKIKKIGVKVNNNCGMHVHVDIQDFSENDIGRLIQAWICVEKVVLLAVPRRRRWNKYCMPFCYNQKMLIDQNSDPLDVWNHYKPSHILSHSNIDRRKTMNLVNYTRYLKIKNFKRPTVEFRFPEGTMSAVSVKNWVRLLVNFVTNIKNNKIDLDNIHKFNFEDNLYILGLGHSKNSFNILSRGMRETKIWFLNRILRYSEDLASMVGTSAEIHDQINQILMKMGAAGESKK